MTPPVPALRSVLTQGALIIVVAATIAAAIGAPARAAFPGTNGRVAFARGQAIISQAADGTEKTLATGIVTAPSYSADGSKIVYLRGSIDFGPGWYDVYVMNADGTNKRNITKSVSKYGSPSFSPNGARILFDNYDGNPTGARRLHIINTDGTRRRHFAAGVAGSMSEGVWSPDGTKIAYIGGPVDKAPLLRTISNNGDADTVRVMSSTMKDAAHPDWSPNGNRLVFTRILPEVNSRIVYRINADKTGLTKLADYGAEKGADNAVWSPDGTRIVFDRTDYASGANPTVWRMKADGTNKTRIDTNGHDPSWQPR